MDYRLCSGLTPIFVSVVVSFQPEFLEAVNNISVAVGRDATFTCHVKHLGGYRVSLGDCHDVHTKGISPHFESFWIYFHGTSLKLIIIRESTCSRRWAGWRRTPRPSRPFTSTWSHTIRGSAWVTAILPPGICMWKRWRKKIVVPTFVNWIQIRWKVR